MPNLKETRFFDLHFELGLEWYFRHFSGRKTRLPVGEIAPTYFSSAEARSRIANLVSGARVVCIFRNPIERIVSLYKLKRSLGIIQWSFEEALFRDKELLESSKYATNLRGWQQSLGERQVLPTVYDDLRDNPQSFVDRIADFIGISRFTLPSASMRRVHTSERLTQPRWQIITQNGTRLAQWLKTKRLYRLGKGLRASMIGTFLLRSGAPFEDLSPAAAQTVYNLVCKELDELEAHLGWNLSHWRPHSLDVHAAGQSSLVGAWSPKRDICINPQCLISESFTSLVRPSLLPLSWPHGEGCGPQPGGKVLQRDCRWHSKRGHFYCGRDPTPEN